jgi:hypothetical protein
MSTSSLYILSSIGFSGSMLSGVIGIESWIVIVLSLVFLCGLYHLQAKRAYGFIVAVSILTGGLVGSKGRLEQSRDKFRLFFGMNTDYVAIQLVTSGIKMVNHEG